MAKNATPDVDLDNPEMEGKTRFADVSVDDDPEIMEITPDAEEAATPSAADESESTSRRSRGRAKFGQPAPAARNLESDPDFVAYKAKKDQEIAESARRAARAESELQAQRDQLAAIQAERTQAQLQAQLEDEDDPGKRQQIIDQIASQRAMTMAQGWRQWESYVKSQAAAAGLSPDEFDPYQYQGEQGRVAFERDMHAKARAKLEQEREELRKATAPEAIDEIVKRKVAEAMQRQGLNTVDLGEGAPVAPDTWARDVALLRQGKLPRGALAKKYGKEYGE